MSFANRVVIDESGERVFIELTAEAAVAKRDELRGQKRRAFIATAVDELAAMMAAAKAAENDQGVALTSAAHPGSVDSPEGTEEIRDIGDVSESALERVEIEVPDDALNTAGTQEAGNTGDQQA